MSITDFIQPTEFENYAFYSELEGKDGYYWVMPSTDLHQFSLTPGSNINRKKSKKEFEYSVRLAGSKCNPFMRFEKYRGNDGFKLLK